MDNTHHPTPEDAIGEAYLTAAEIPPTSAWGREVWEHARGCGDEKKKGFEFADLATARRAYRSSYYFGRKYNVKVSQRGCWLWLTRESCGELVKDS